MVGENDQDEEHAQAHGGHGEEIEGDQVPNVIGQECAPGLRGRRGALRHQPGDCALGHVDAELEELTMDSRGAPEGVRGGHAGDQSFDLGVDGRAASGGPAGEFGPVLTEASPLPPQDGVGSHDDEGLFPPDPDPGQSDPEEAISSAQSRPGHHSLVDGELVAQGQVLEGELAVAAEQEGKESKQVEQEKDHRVGIVSGSEPTDQPLAAGRGFGEGQVQDALQQRRHISRRLRVRLVALSSRGERGLRGSASSKQRGRRRRVDHGPSTRYRWRGVRYPDTATIPKGRVDRFMEHGW